MKSQPSLFDSVSARPSGVVAAGFSCAGKVEALETARPAPTSATGHLTTPAGAACRGAGRDTDSSQLSPAGAYLAHRDDPRTSHEAAARAGEFSHRHRALILGALKEHGPMTYEEIARATDLEPVAVGRRLHELAADSRIDADGVRPTSKGRNATVWRAR